MPRGDGTGPFGILRNCMPVDANGNPIQAPYYVPFYGRRFFGRGGFGRGFRWRYLATGVPGWAAQQQIQQPQAVQPSQPQQTQNEAQKPLEKKQIKNELGQLEQGLERIKERIAELKKVVE